MMKRMLMPLLLALGMMSTSLPAAAQWPDREDTTVYMAIYNHEWQYTLWPSYRDLPLGWNSAGFQGLKPEVLAFIERVWTDMRPLSLRRAMDPTDRCILANLPPHQCQS